MTAKARTQDRSIGKLGRKPPLGPLLVLAAGLAAVPLPAGGQQVPEGAALVESLGCGGCHTGVPFDGSMLGVAPALSSDETPLAPAFIFNYLADPQTIRPDIAPARMPAYDLDERTRLALALYVTNEIELQGVDDAFRSAQGRHPDVTRSTGKVFFDALGCAGCHIHPSSEAQRWAPDLSGEGSRVQGDWLRDYLATPSPIRPAGPQPGLGGQMPDFRLSGAEVEAIATFLGEQAVEGLPEWDADHLSPFSMQKAETLLRDRWSCLGCHQLGEDGGRIGPRLDGIADRLRPAFVRRLIESPAHLAPGTVMPASLEQPDRMDLMASFLLQREGSWAGAEYLGSLPEAMLPTLNPLAGGSVSDRRSASADSGVAGEALYQRQCAACHGVEGQGDGFNAQFLPTTPTLHAAADSMSLRPDDTLYDGIHAGGWILGKSHRMPAFGASLAPEQIKSLVLYIRELCECQGPAWSRDGRRGR